MKILLVLLTLLLFQPAEARSQQGLADFVIDNPAAGPHLYPWGSGRIAVHGDWSAFLYRTALFDDWLYLQDASGLESHIRLPDRFDHNDRANAEYVLTSPTRLWLWSGVFGQAKLRRYRLEGQQGLPTRAVLVSVSRIGDNNSRPGGLIALESGGLLGMWYQFEYHADRHLAVGFFYIDPSGKPQTLYPLHLAGKGGNIVGSRCTLAQHPADGSIWAFLKRDSYHEISAIVLRETVEGIGLSWMKTDFISQRDGDHGPDSEYPYLVAAPDRRRQSLRLAYQNRKSAVFYVADGRGRSLSGLCGKPMGGLLDPSLYIKGANLSIAEISADRTTSFLELPVFVDAARYFGFSVTDRLWVVYQPVGCWNTSYDSVNKRREVHATFFDQGIWAPPLRLGESSEHKEYYASPVLFNVARPQFALRLSDGLVHQFEGF